MHLYYKSLYPYWQMESISQIIHTIWFHTFIRYSVYLCGFLLWRRRLQALLRMRIIPLLWWTLRLWILLWSRRREPYQIQIVTHEVTAPFDATIAFIADLHLGVYKDEQYLLNVVQHINAMQEVDIVLVGGDRTLLPQKEVLINLVTPLWALQKPVYTVLGNHDEQQPWPDIKFELIQALEQFWVRYLENDLVMIDDWYVLGLGDLDAGLDHTSMINDTLYVDRTIVLAHHPDTTRKYWNKKPFLTLAGHTHCGQIRIPRLYRYMIPTSGSVDEKYDCGWYDLSTDAKLFITPWLGETLLPMRLFNPPTIDILQIRSSSL